MQREEGSFERVIFISGGVRSGKSGFAEALAVKYAQTNRLPLSYIATSKVEDAEMADRVKRHQAARQGTGLNWNLHEIPTQVAQALETKAISGLVLLDCLTVLFANELFTELVSEDELESRLTIVLDQVKQGLIELASRVDLLIIVSNELHYEFHRDPYVRAYQQGLGLLHQYIVTHCRQAYLVEAGIPQAMKES